MLGRGSLAGKGKKRKRRQAMSFRHAKQARHDKKYKLFPDLGKMKHQDVYLAEFIAKGASDQQVFNGKFDPADLVC